MLKPLKDALNEVLWNLREGQAVVGVKRDTWIALIEAILLDARENETLFVDRFSLEEVHQIAEGYAATVGGTQFGRTRTDAEDAEDTRRNLEKVILEVKEKRTLPG